MKADELLTEADRSSVVEYVLRDKKTGQYVVDTRVTLQRIHPKLGELKDALTYSTLDNPTVWVKDHPSLEIMKCVEVRLVTGETVDIK